MISVLHKIEGMAVSKSTQARVVGIITYMIHPYACFSHYGAMSRNTCACARACQQWTGLVIFMEYTITDFTAMPVLS